MELILPGQANISLVVEVEKRKWGCHLRAENGSPAPAVRHRAGATAELKNSSRHLQGRLQCIHVLMKAFVTKKEVGGHGKANSRIASNFKVKQYVKKSIELT